MIISQRAAEDFFADAILRGFEHDLCVDRRNGDGGSTIQAGPVQRHLDAEHRSVLSCTLVPGTTSGSASAGPFERPVVRCPPSDDACLRGAYRRFIRDSDIPGQARRRSSLAHTAGLPDCSSPALRPPRSPPSRSLPRASCAHRVPGRRAWSERHRRQMTTPCPWPHRPLRCHPRDRCRSLIH
jgi:hypothetical protein